MTRRQYESIGCRPLSIKCCSKHSLFQRRWNQNSRETLVNKATKICSWWKDWLNLIHFPRKWPSLSVFRKLLETNPKAHAAFSFELCVRNQCVQTQYFTMAYRLQCINFPFEWGCYLFSLYFAKFISFIHVVNSFIVFSKRNWQPKPYFLIDIIISRPDKGSGVVIMNKSDHLNKLHSILDDSSKFQKSNSTKDHIEINEQRMVECLKRLKGQGAINEILYEDLRPHGTITPRLYGLPKIHKQGIPLRQSLTCLTHRIMQQQNGSPNYLFLSANACAYTVWRILSILYKELKTWTL